MTTPTNNPRKYLLLISIHGLIRGNNLELGRDADTGGQTKYVIDLARALAENQSVGQIDLVTRRIIDPTVDEDYAVPIEQLDDKIRTIRIDCGPDEYIFKEQLWDYLDSFVDNLMNWLNTQPRRPDFVHSHYADAGYVGVRLSNLLSVPLIHTGHSLGRDKRKQLLARGLSQEEIERSYNIARRIDAEEEILANADLVVTSTHNEIEEQYGLYNYHDPSRMAVIPPGTNLDQFHPPLENEKFTITNQFARFYENTEKPLILALSRLDERKNILTLIEAYGESDTLQQTANLLIIAGNRDDTNDMEEGPLSVLSNMLLLIDHYDLYGKVAIPKSIGIEDVPRIYRMVALSKGVFINPALTEPFGLTILEAAASGLPVVATENGGPVDIIANCKNGELIDPLDKTAIASALLKFLLNDDAWEKASKNGINEVCKHYSWQAHTHLYLQKISQFKEKYRPLPKEHPGPGILRYRDRAIFTDIDQNMLGDHEASQHFVSLLRLKRRFAAFGIATGRRIDSALAVMKKAGIPAPDILISSLGTRIHYGPDLTEDDFWANHIDHNWSHKQLRRVLESIPGLTIQPKNMQTPYKLSYYYHAEKAPPLNEIVMRILQNELTVNVISSFGQFLDIVPSRASKGQALRYVSQRLDIPLEHILVAGGSGADEDMMRGNTLAVVVANRHNEELSNLEDLEHIYFADRPHAWGIMEAIEYYDFFGDCKSPQ